MKQKYIIIIVALIIAFALLFIYSTRDIEEEIQEDKENNITWIERNETRNYTRTIVYECYKECVYKEKMNKNIKDLEIDYKNNNCCSEYYSYISRPCGFTMINPKEEDDLKYFYFRDREKTDTTKLCEWRERKE